MTSEINRREILKGSLAADRKDKRGVEARQAVSISRNAVSGNLGGATRTSRKEISRAATTAASYSTISPL
jgi:hypothetical protein